MHLVKAFGTTKKQSARNQRRVTVANQLGLWLLMLALLVAASARGQETFVLKDHPTPQTARPPMSHLYMNFLLYQNHLDKAAALHEAQGKDGSWLRNMLEEKLGFSGSQFSIVRATAVRLESELKDINTRGGSIIRADRASRAKESSQAGIPGVAPPALNDLAKEREDLLQREMDSLNHELGPQASAKLQSVIEGVFSQNRAVHYTPAPPRTSKPVPPTTGIQPVQP